jgi:hypothetical protein
MKMYVAVATCLPAVDNDDDVLAISLSGHAARVLPSIVNFVAIPEMRQGAVSALPRFLRHKFPKVGALSFQ